MSDTILASRCQCGAWPVVFTTDKCGGYWRVSCSSKECTHSSTQAFGSRHGAVSSWNVIVERNKPEKRIMTVVEPELLHRYKQYEAALREIDRRAMPCECKRCLACIARRALEGK